MPRSAALLLALAACAAPPETAPLAPPELATTAEVYAGDALLGRVARVPAGELLGVTVAWSWLPGNWLQATRLAEGGEGRAWPGLSSVAECARSLVAPQVGAPFVVDADALTNLRVARGSDAVRLGEALGAEGPGQTAHRAAQSVGLPPGASAAFAATPGGSQHRSLTPFTLHVCRGGDGVVRAMLVLPGAGSPTRSRCVVLADALTEGAESLALVDGTASEAEPGPTLVWRVRVHANVDADIARTSRTAIERAVAATAARAAQDPRHDVAQTEQQVAREALAFSWTRQRALLHLATLHGAELTADATLLADAAMLADIAAGVAATLAPTSGDALGWTLEQNTVRALVARLQGPGLAPEMISLVHRHLGETADAASALGAAAQRCRGQAEFQAWLRAEHVLALEDRDAAVRVRAFDWLVQRQAAIADYDPLAPLAQRRAALSAAGASAR